MWKQDESGRVHTPLEPLVLAATLALIPVLIIEADTTSEGWLTFAEVANWLIRAVFATELAAVLIVASRRRAALRAHWVFADAAGRPLYPERCSDHLSTTIRAARLPVRAIRFHALRHYAVSCLIEQGANIVLLSKVAGHASPDVTLRVYSHLMPSGASDAADRFDPIGAILG
jgi:integrase